MFHDTARCSVSRALMSLSMALAALSSATAAEGLVRGKQPDRGRYQSPVLVQGQLRKVNIPRLEAPSDRDDQETNVREKLVPAPVLVEADSGVIEVDAPIRQVSYESNAPARLKVRNGETKKLHNASYQVDRHADQVEKIRSSESSVSTCSCPSCQAKQDGAVAFADAYGPSESWTDGEYFDESCDGSYCDSMGCDSMGCGRIGFRSDNFFGSVELLLMFRKGDLPPPLVTTGPDTDQNTAGELGQPDTEILVGSNRILDDLQLGGRLTIGQWLDSCKDRSWVARGWFSAPEEFDFFATQDNNNVLTRPFFNVTDGQTPAQDTQIIAFTSLANGEIGVEADSYVYGADISIRQLWAKHCGATVDLLYGYQYMGLDESLGIRSRATSLDNNFAPVGSTISVADTFDVNNQFHGGQIGFATAYRERCWSFQSLVKVGFGNLKHQAELQGVTVTSIDGNNATDPNGLLVRSTNAGTHESNTFAWVPELDFSLGWQRYPCFDVTFGYHIVALTDALQVSGVIDPDLAVNFASTGVASPSANFRYETYYVQGIHFGLSYIR